MIGKTLQHIIVNSSGKKVRAHTSRGLRRRICWHISAVTNETSSNTRKPVLKHGASILANVIRLANKHHKPILKDGCSNCKRIAWPTLKHDRNDDSYTLPSEEAKDELLALSQESYTQVALNCFALHCSACFYIALQCFALPWLGLLCIALNCAALLWFI